MKNNGRHKYIKLPLQDRLLGLSCEAVVSDLDDKDRGFSDHQNK